MFHMKDFCFGMTEPVWILNHNKDGDTSHKEENESGSKNEPENEGYSYLYPYQPQNEPENEGYSYYPYRYHHQQFLATPTYDADDDMKKNKKTKVVMKVPICCSECEDSVKVSLSRLNGVESVICNIFKEMVTVVGTAAPADILLESRKVFKKSRMWSDDD